MDTYVTVHEFIELINSGAFEIRKHPNGDTMKFSIRQLGDSQWCVISYLGMRTVKRARKFWLDNFRVIVECESRSEWMLAYDHLRFVARRVNAI